MMANKDLIMRMMLFLLGVTVLAGCTQEIEILQYPEFYDPDNPSNNIKNIAVLPFRNQAAGTSARRAGEAIAENLAGMLSASRTYREVYNHNNLAALMDQHDLKIASGGDPAASAAVLRKHGNVEAIITGAVTTYTSTTSRRIEEKPIRAYNARTKSMYIAGYRRVTITRNEGNVSVTATLTRVSDGTTIHATTPVSRHSVAEGESPSTDQYGCLREASSKAVRGLLEHFAVVRKIIKVSKRKAFRTASEYYDGKWEYTKTFKTTDKKMHVVLRLPDSCDRNRFRITIIRKGQREDLVLKNIRWQKKDGKVGMGFEFNPSEIAAKGGGAGKYVAKFYSGPAPKLFAEFKLIEP